MKIKTITSQTRRDFEALYECEHCGHTEKGYGYDDSYFHSVIIPKMTCSVCGKGSDPNYRPLTTKYPDNLTI